MIPVLHPPTHLVSPQETLFPQIKKGLKGKCFANVEEVKPKTAETQRHPNRQVQKLFWAAGKHLNRCMASSGEYFLKVTEI